MCHIMPDTDEWLWFVPLYYSNYFSILLLEKYEDTKKNPFPT